MVNVHRAPAVQVEHVTASSSKKSGTEAPKTRSRESRAVWSTRDLSQHHDSTHTRTSTSSTTADINPPSSQFPQKSGYNVASSTVIATADKKLSQPSYQERLAAYSQRHGWSGNEGLARIATSSSQDPEEDAVVQLLALQMYHLPGNSWCQDWMQYMRNNHPVFGICCHHKLHPIGSCQRIIALCGTVLFGLALTNLFYLFYLWNPRFDQVVAEFVTTDGDSWTLTTGMLLLWTLGSSVHCAFNLAIWHIGACACCRSGGCCQSCACCPSLGKHLSRVLILCIVAIAVMIVLLRVAITNQQDNLAEQDTNNISGDKKVNIGIDDTLSLDVESASQFQFVAAYLVEMVLSLFVYYPIGGTVLFSGILACGCKIPLLGGRPYEVALEERRRKSKGPQEGKRLASLSFPGNQKKSLGSLASIGSSQIPTKQKRTTALSPHEDLESGGNNASWS